VEFEYETPLRHAEDSDHGVVSTGSDDDMIRLARSRLVFLGLAG